LFDIFLLIAAYSNAISTLVLSLLSELGHIWFALVALSDLYIDGWEANSTIPLYIRGEDCYVYNISLGTPTMVGRSLLLLICNLYNYSMP